MFTKITNVFLDIMFPPICLGCKEHLEKRNEFICAACLGSIKLNNTLFCPVCQVRLAENKKICNHGPEKNMQFPYLLAAATNYDSQIIQNLIHYYKYKNFNEISNTLGNILIEYLWFTFENSKLIRQLADENYSVAYIPLHFIRENTRGFNQSKLLAQIISKNFNLELVDALIRIKNNPPQAKLRNHNERQKSISNAFQIANPDKIKNKNIILLDDVHTSGATMSEAAKILKQNGANKIIALVIAKA